MYGFATRSIYEDITIVGVQRTAKFRPMLGAQAGL
jgi:hypothetical protein